MTKTQKISLKQVSKSFGATEVIPPPRPRYLRWGIRGFRGAFGLWQIHFVAFNRGGWKDLTSGQIIIDGTDRTHAAPVDRRLAMVFQSYALYPHHDRA